MEDLLRHLLAGATGTQEKPTPWPSAVVVAVLAVLVVGVLCVVGILQRRNAAATAHRLDVVENDLRQAEVLRVVHKHQRGREQADREITGLEVKRKQLQEKLVQLEMSRERFSRKVELITAWDQVW